MAAALALRRNRAPIYGAAGEEAAVRVGPAAHAVTADARLTAEERRFVVESLKKNFLFRGMATSTLDHIATKVKRSTYPQSGTDVIRQGDEGDFLYIVDHGKLEVFVDVDAQSSSQPRTPPLVAAAATARPPCSRKILEYTRGQSFGELALLFDCPRSTTVRTSTPFVAVYALDKGTFKATVARTKEHQRRLLLFHEIPLLQQSLTTAQLAEVSRRAQIRRFDAGEPGPDGAPSYSVVFAKGTCEARGNVTHIRRASLTTRLQNAAQRAPAGAPLYIVQVGRVLECASPEDAKLGRGHVLHAGDVIGINSFLEGKPLAYHYYTRETTLLLLLTDDDSGPSKTSVAWSPAVRQQQSRASFQLRDVLREPLELHERVCALRQARVGGLQFAWLGREVLAQLAEHHMTAAVLPEGTVIARRGTFADRLTLVVAGSVETKGVSEDAGDGEDVIAAAPSTTAPPASAGRYGTGVLLASAGASLITRLPEMYDVECTSTCKVFQLAPMLASAGAMQEVPNLPLRVPTTKPTGSHTAAEKQLAYDRACSELHCKGAANALALALHSIGGINLGEKVVDRLAHDFCPVPFKKGAVLVREGAVGDKFYLLAYGEVEVSKRSIGDEATDRLDKQAAVETPPTKLHWPRRATPATGALAKVAIDAVTRVKRDSAANHQSTRLMHESTAMAPSTPARRPTRLSHAVTKLVGGSGAYFGERALLDKKPRAATVRAVTDGMCYSLSRDAFERHFGKLRDLMKAAGEREELAQKERSITLDDLSVHRTIGVGAFARVRLVKDRVTKNVYALKSLSRKRLKKYRCAHRVKQERAMLESFSHPFITRFVKSFKDAEDVHMLLDVNMGGALFRTLNPMLDDGFDETSARFYGACVVSALHYLHARGVVYRDVRPNNVMLDAQGYACLIDFAFSKDIGFDDRTYSVVGAPDYLAPEIILRKGHGFGVDRWSLGCLLYEILMNVPAFEAVGCESDVYRNILDGRYPSMRRNLSVQARGIVDGLLTVDECKRLGYSNGMSDVMEHGWFWRICWADLEARRIAPPSKPDLRSADDDRHFDHFEDDDTSWRPGAKWDKGDMDGTDDDWSTF